MHYGDIIVVTYEETVGFEKTKFAVIGAIATANENEYQVIDDVVITYAEQNIEYTLSIPQGIDVSKNSNSLTSTDTLHYGDLIIVLPNENYYVEDLLVTGAVATSNENEYKVTGNVNIRATITSAIRLTVTTDLGTNQYKVKKNDTIANALTFAGVDITDNNSIGLYSDNAYTTPIANSTTLTSDTTIYTAMATLDKLTINGTKASPASTSVRGDIVIPKCITTLGSFENCLSIESIILPDSITTIPTEVFYCCYGLKSIRLPQGIESIGIRAFSCCSSLQYINIPEGVKIIGYEAFELCSNLNMAKLPNSLESIGGDAFAFCYSLMSIKIPQNVTEIVGYPFWRCFSLIEVYNLSSLSIQKGADTFGGVAQYAKEVYTDSTTSSKIQLIDDVYYYVNGEDFIAIGTKEKTIYKNLTLNEKTTEINSYAFNRVETHYTITIPGSVKTIGRGAFYETDITKIVIEEGLEELQFEAFLESDIDYMTLPNSLITIGASAFDSSNFTSINIPNNVKTIGDLAFRFSSLRTINISASVESIAEDAFIATYDLVQINVDENNKNYSSVDGVLFNKDKTKLLVYPCSKTGNSYEIPLSVTTISYYAFKDYCCLTSITISENVTDIEENTFNNYHTPIITATINSTNIATTLIEEDSNGCLIYKAETVYILTSIEDISASTYLLENFTKQATSDKAGYDMYVRNAE